MLGLRSLYLWSAWAVGLALALHSRSAGAQHVDILLARLNDALVTGSFDFGTGEAQLTKTVFERAFEAQLGDGAVTGNDPGFNAVHLPPEPFESLPPDADVMVGPGAMGPAGTALAYWDGTGTPSLSGAPDAVALEVALTGVIGNLEEFSLASPGAQPFPLARTDQYGGIHQHLQFTLRAVSAGQAMDPPTGVYVFSLTLSVELLAPTDVWLVLGHESDEEALHLMTEHLAELVSPPLSPWDAGATVAAGAGAGSTVAMDAGTVSQPLAETELVTIDASFPDAEAHRQSALPDSGLISSRVVKDQKPATCSHTPRRDQVPPTYWWALGAALWGTRRRGGRR